jgi:hypothetical protein
VEVAVHQEVIVDVEVVSTAREREQREGRSRSGRVARIVVDEVPMNAISHGRDM